MEEAVIGERYRIEWSDCCVHGSFEAVLERKNYDAAEQDYLESLTFANGVTIGGDYRLTRSSGAA